jgi:hypothetical protein
LYDSQESRKRPQFGTGECTKIDRVDLDCPDRQLDVPRAIQTA